jgi:hypothetical protein
MILLEIVSRWPETEAVFRRYDEQAGVCLCCTCLFESPGEIASRYGFDLKTLISDIRNAIGPSREGVATRLFSKKQNQTERRG